MAVREAIFCFERRQLWDKKKSDGKKAVVFLTYILKDLRNKLIFFCHGQIDCHPGKPAEFAFDLYGSAMAFDDLLGFFL